MWTIALQFLKRPTILIILALTLALAGLTWRLDNLGAKLDAREIQIEALIKKRAELSASLEACYDDQKAASEISDEYESKITNLKRKYAADIKRLQQPAAARCIPIIRPTK